MKTYEEAIKQLAKETAVVKQHMAENPKEANALQGRINAVTGWIAYLYDRTYNNVENDVEDALESR